MNNIDSRTLDSLWHDFDAREDQLREIATDRLKLKPPPIIDDQIVASYFFAFRTHTLADAVEEIAYHATSGIHHPPPGSLLDPLRTLTSHIALTVAIDSQSVAYHSLFACGVFLFVFSLATNIVLQRLRTPGGHAHGA